LQYSPEGIRMLSDMPAFRLSTFLSLAVLTQKPQYYQSAHVMLSHIDEELLNWCRAGCGVV